MTNLFSTLRAQGKNISGKNRQLLAIGVFGLVATSTLMATAPQHDPSVVEEKAWPVSTISAIRESLSPQLQLFGRIETPLHSHLSAAVRATVEQLNVTEGQFVQAGDVLLTLDDADEKLRLQQREADVAEAQAALTSAMREFQADRDVLNHLRELQLLTQAKVQRLLSLRQRNLVATELLEDTRGQLARQSITLARQQLKVDNHPDTLAIAEARVKRAQALRDEQLLNLSRTIIQAPFGGRISRVHISPGDRVMEGEDLVALYDTDSLRVRAALPSSAVPDIKQALSQGQSIGGYIEIAGLTIPLSLQQLAAEVASGRSGVDGLFQIGTHAEALELGKAVALTVVLAPLDNVVAVPVQSIYGSNRLYTVREGRLQGIEIRNLGQRIDQRGQLQILVRSADLEETDQVLTTSLPKARTGLRVEVIKAAS